MTYRELADWVKANTNLNEQTVLALQEDDAPDGIIEGIQVCYLPFVAYTTTKHSRTIKGKLWPEENIFGLHVSLEEQYTWQNLLDWIDGLENKDMDVFAMAAWHKCAIKLLTNMLYAYEV